MLRFGGSEKRVAAGLSAAVLVATLGVYAATNSTESHKTSARSCELGAKPSPTVVRGVAVKALAETILHDYDDALSGQTQEISSGNTTTRTVVLGTLPTGLLAYATGSVRYRTLPQTSSMSASHPIGLVEQIEVDAFTPSCDEVDVFRPDPKIPLSWDVTSTESGGGQPMTHRTANSAENPAAFSGIYNQAANDLATSSGLQGDVMLKAFL